MTGDGSITTHGAHGDLGLGIPKAPARQDVLSCQLQWLNHLTRLVDEENAVGKLGQGEATMPSATTDSIHIIYI